MTNVTSLLKTVKSVEDETVRGTRALESAMEAISQEIKVGCCSTCLCMCCFSYVHVVEHGLLLNSTCH